MKQFFASFVLFLFVGKANPLRAIQILALLFLPYAASSNTYTVTNTNSSGAGSFRQAIIDANANPDADVIEFNIGGGGAHQVDANFPGAVLNSDVTVDGTTQPGYSGTPLIEIILKFPSVQGENVWIKGLAFNGTNISATSGTWSNLKVEDCSFTQVYIGIIGYYGSDLQIINCHFDILNSGENIAVLLEGIEENTLPKGVLAYGNTFDMEYGSGLPYFYSLNLMEDGLLIGNQDVSGANITIEDDAGFASSPAGCVVMGDCHGVVFDNLQLVKTGDAGEQGLLMNFCTDVTVQNCTFENLNSSVAFWPCQDVQILNNTFTNCGKGAEVFLNVVITDLGSNLLPNGLLMSGNQFSDIGRGIGLTMEVDGGSMVVGSPVTPDANVILTEDDGHDDIETDVIFCGYEGGLGSYTIRDLDFTGTGTMEGTGLVFQYGAGLVENCRITNFEFGTALIATAGISVQCNLIYNNGTGVARNYSDGNDQIQNNTFINNLLALDNTFSTSQLTAENNYWGGGAPALNGPNGYAGDVDTAPYLGTPPGCAPTLPIPEPEIVLTGNSLPIPDGSTTPDAGNHTDFGIITSPLTRTFTIENTGPGDLTISNITSDNSTFSVAALTPASPIASGNSAAFDVTFTPAEPGLESATISIDNNDGDESPYTFVIKGIGQTIVSGTLIWEHDDVTGVGNATVALTGGQSGSVTTPAAGTYSFTIGSGTDFEITPTKTINKLNGVTVADAVAIQKHVAGVIPITDAYKQVGADVNKSNSITTADVVTIVQALAGNPAGLANFKTSWRFAPTAHTMNIPPWGFPEKIILNDVVGEVPDQDFYGIKTGDIVATFANPANFGAGNPLVLNTQDRVLQSGEEVTVEFKAEQLDDLAAIQFALKFDVEKLELTDIQPLGGLPLTADNFGTYNLAEGEIRAVWSQAEGMFLEEAASVFQLKFNVVQSGGKLSEALELDESVLLALAYTGALAESRVELKFGETTGVPPLAGQAGLQLFQNRPNPFKGQTTISFFIPQESEAQLRIYDVSGRVLAERKAQYAAGRHEETFDLGGVTGVLWYELTTPFGVLAKKMVAVGK